MTDLEKMRQAAPAARNNRREVNTAEMIYAKEKPAVARAVVGTARLNEIAARAPVDGGRRHALCEERRQRCVRLLRRRTCARSP